MGRVLVEPVPTTALANRWMRIPTPNSGRRRRRSTTKTKVAVPLYFALAAMDFYSPPTPPPPLFHSSVFSCDGRKVEMRRRGGGDSPVAGRPLRSRGEKGSIFRSAWSSCAYRRAVDPELGKRFLPRGTPSVYSVGPEPGKRLPRRNSTRPTSSRAGIGRARRAVALKGSAGRRQCTSPLFLSRP